MSFEFKQSADFDAEVKRLSKKYKSIKADLIELKNSLQENPFQGTEIAPNVYKIRMAIKSKGKGKSGGARIISHNLLVTKSEGTIYLLIIYDKSDASNVKMDIIKEIVKNLREK